MALVGCLDSVVCLVYLVLAVSLVYLVLVVSLVLAASLEYLARAVLVVLQV